MNLFQLNENDIMNLFQLNENDIVYDAGGLLTGKYPPLICQKKVKIFLVYYGNSHIIFAVVLIKIRRSWQRITQSNLSSD